MRTGQDFKFRAIALGCSEEEIDFIANKIANNRDSLVFTKLQFKVFAQFYAQFNGICPGSWQFEVYPKNNGIKLYSGYAQAEVYMFLVHINENYQFFRPSFGPGFIEELAECWEQYEDCEGKLILLGCGNETLDDYTWEQDYFATYGKPNVNCRIGGGRVYRERVAQPMPSLESLSELYGDGSSVYDENDRILIRGIIRTPRVVRKRPFDEVESAVDKLLEDFDVTHSVKRKGKTLTLTIQ